METAIVDDVAVNLHGDAGQVYGLLSHLEEMYSSYHMGDEGEFPVYKCDHSISKHCPELYKNVFQYGSYLGEQLGESCFGDTESLGFQDLLDEAEVLMRGMCALETTSPKMYEVLQKNYKTAQDARDEFYNVSMHLIKSNDGT